MLKRFPAIPVVMGLLLSQAAHAEKEITVHFRDTPVVDGTTYRFLGENYGGTYTVLIGKPGSMWAYSFPEQNPDSAYNPAKVSTHEGNVYQSLETHADRIVLKLLDEKAAPMPLPANYLIIMFGEDLFFEVDSVEYLLEIDGHLLDDDGFRLLASVTLAGNRTYFDMKKDVPMRYKDLTLTCRFIHAEMGQLKSGYIIEYQHTSGAAIRSGSGMRFPDRKSGGGHDALGRPPTRSFPTHWGPMIFGL